MAKIFVTGSTIADEAQELMARRGCSWAFGHESDSSGDIARKLTEYDPDGLIVRKGRIDRDVIEAAPALKAISKHGVGVDNIDVAAATGRGIPVMITSRANFESVAEHALALMFALARRVPVQDAKVRRGAWDKTGYDGHELLGRTLGLVGIGRIGRRLAELVGPLRMRVVAFDPHAKPPHPVPLVPTLDELLAESDIVSIHCPLTEETRGLIGAAALERMRPSAWLVNTARGGIIEEEALVEALRRGQIGGAALDTFAREPPSPDNQLFETDNVVLSNHIGGVSGSSWRNMGVGAVENILGVLDGATPDESCVVNPEVLAPRR